MTDLVVISVGTDMHPFERLVSWADRWATDHPAVKVILQRGTASAPAGIESHELIPHGELRELFRSATAVVSHGGPSTLMDARMAGRLPIVVARDPDRGEHVDGHQLRFAEHMARHHLAVVVDTEEAFRDALAEALADPSAFTLSITETATPDGVVEFGAVADELLGITTALKIESPEPTSVNPTEEDVR